MIISLLEISRFTLVHRIPVHRIFSVYYDSQQSLGDHLSRFKPILYLHLIYEFFFVVSTLKPHQLFSKYIRQCIIFEVLLPSGATDWIGSQVRLFNFVCPIMVGAATLGKIQDYLSTGQAFRTFPSSYSCYLSFFPDSLFPH